MPIKRENQLTSVKVDTELFTLFKIKCIENNKHNHISTTLFI